MMCKHVLLIYNSCFVGTPNGSFVESELDNSQQPCFSARVGDGQTGSVSSMFPER